MEMNDKGIIYICIEREFLNNPIYKIGHTQNDDINKYIKGRYPKNTKLVYHRKTNDSKICEKILIKYCDITCHKRKDIGNLNFNMAMMRFVFNIDLCDGTML